MGQSYQEVSSGNHQNNSVSILAVNERKGGGDIIAFNPPMTIRKKKEKECDQGPQNLVGGCEWWQGRVCVV